MDNWQLHYPLRFPLAPKGASLTHTFLKNFASVKEHPLGNALIGILSSCRSDFVECSRGSKWENPTFIIHTEPLIIERRITSSSRQKTPW